MNINYGIMVLDTRLDADGTNPILHFCGFEEFPTDDDFDDLRHELSIDEEFGLTEMMDFVVLIEASADVVAMYREMYNE